ncbi:MFS general substrate transporter [Violaceomyces palustris]|uniref:MFS general substrate transporter n=1 Tax=Violaceomyces palustris TaxID=1673888 RepID=A0ACD0P5F4_9BASI|nr:MFS general substrate transporter [Violaceomyces palustris]
MASLKAIESHLDPDPQVRQRRVDPAVRPQTEFCHSESSKDGTNPFEIRFQAEDAANPLNWSNERKWAYTLLVGVTMFNATFASTLPSGALRSITRAFYPTMAPIESALITTIFVGGCVLGPCFWAPLSEIKGRRMTYLVSTAAYTLMQLGCALATSTAMLLVFRFLSGAFASSALTNAGGVITDLFPPMSRGTPMISHFFDIQAGPIFGPLVGGIVGEKASWRWLFWLLMIIGCALEAALFLLDETYAPLILTQRAKQIRKEVGPRRSLKAILTVNLARPLVMMVTEPIVALATVYMSFVFSLMFMFFAIWPLIFSRIGIYGFDPVKTGLSFTPMGVGCLIAAFMIPYFNRFYVRKSREARRPVPEARLLPAFFVGPLLALGLFCSGWTARRDLHWILPMLAGLPIGCAMVLVFQGWLTYLGDAYGVHATSAIAATVMARSLAGATLPLATHWLVESLGGLGWTSTLLGGFSLIISPLPLIVYR